MIFQNRSTFTDNILVHIEYSVGGCIRNIPIDRIGVHDRSSEMITIFKGNFDDLSTAFMYEIWINEINKLEIDIPEEVVGGLFNV